MPARRDVPLFRVELGEEEVREVTDTLRSGWLTSGPKVERFERALRDRIGAPAALATSSCTGALHLALQALGIGRGHEVVTGALGCSATANVVVQVGARPVFVDVERDTLNLDPALVEAALTPRTGAVVAVHFGGHPCELDPLRGLCSERGIALIEDAAHALAASYRGRPAGTFGVLGCFSFYANKIITTGEGGMLVGDRDLVARARVMARQGVDRPSYARSRERAWAYSVVFPGLKWNMSDVAASIGIHQLARLERLQERRRRIAALYDDAFAGVDELEPPTVRPHVEPSWHHYLVRLEGDRDEAIAALAKRGVHAAAPATPINREPWYASAPRPLPVAEGEWERSLLLPLFPTLAESDAERVAAGMLKVLPARRERTVAAR